MTAPTPTTEANFRAYVLAELRCATLRARLAQLDLDTAGIALRAGMIDAETALAWLAEAGALHYAVPTLPSSKT